MYNGWIYRNVRLLTLRMACSSHMLDLTFHINLQFVRSEKRGPDSVVQVVFAGTRCRQEGVFTSTDIGIMRACSRDSIFLARTMGHTRTELA
jgi:hypothetical protein